MTQTTEMSAIKVGDEIRDSMFRWVKVVETKIFRQGSRIWLRLDNGLEETHATPTTVVINRQVR